MDDVAPARGNRENQMRTGMVWTLLLSFWAGGVQAQEPLHASNLQPLQVGNEWTFGAGPIEVIERVAKHEVVDGWTCARVETLFNGKVVAYEHLATRPDGLYRVSIAGRPVNPPLKFLKFPAQPGDTWTVNSETAGQKIAGKLETGRQQVETPAGKFDAITSVGTDFGLSDSKMTFTYFFAPGVGKVKQVVSAGGREAVLELKSFKPGPTTAAR